MKVLIPTTEKKPDMNTRPARILGSAKSYIIFDTDDNSFTSIENHLFDKHNHIEGDELKTLGVNNVVTEVVCETCYNNIKSAGIDIWEDDKSASIRETTQKLSIGGLFLKNAGEHISMHKMDKATVEKRLLKHVVQEE